MLEAMRRGIDPSDKTPAIQLSASAVAVQRERSAVPCANQTLSRIPANLRHLPKVDSLPVKRGQQRVLQKNAFCRRPARFRQ